MKYIILLFPIFFLLSCGKKEQLSFLNKEEQKWLLEHGDSIRVAQDPLYAPLDYLTGSGNIEGISNDYLSIIEQKLDIKFLKIHKENLSANLALIKNKQVDIATSLSKTPERSKYLIFTKPYFESPVVIISNSDKTLNVEDLHDKKISVSSNFAAHEYLKRSFPNFELDLVVDDREGIKKIVFNETDVMLIDLASASFHLENLGIVNLHVVGNIDLTYEIAMGVRNDLPILRDILDKTIASISRKEKSKIRKEWVFLATREFWERRNFWYWLGAIVFVLSTVFVISLAFNKRLKRLIRKRTVELNRELSQRLIAETSLRESETRYRIVAEQSGQIVYDYNLKNDSIIWSGDLENTLGFTFEEYKSKKIKDWQKFIHPDDEQKTIDLLDKSIANGNSYDLVYRYKRKDASYVPINDKGIFLKDFEGNIYRMLGIMNDISKQIEREEQLKEAKKNAENADRLKTQFLSNMSHEIRTPMNSIIGFSSLLTTPELSKEKQDKYCDLIQKSSSYLQNIIDDVMDFAMIESEQVNLYVEQVSLKEIIDNVLDIFRNNDAVKNNALDIKSKIELKECEYIIRTDEVRLKQILINLVGNACKFTKKGSILVQCSKSNEGFILFKVEDTGIGIPKDQVQSIFERFCQVENNNGLNNSGTGLGLSISKGYVELLGGKIWCESTEGVGTSFFFTLSVDASK